ncbi:MAG: DUF4450 domain-containing protein [Prolixibacteraceae bacterium]
MKLYPKTHMFTAVSLLRFSGLLLAGLIFNTVIHSQASAQSLKNNDRALRYYPDGSDFVISNGTHRFNRALYGTNTAFRVEAGDLPEFAMYLPGMGGNLHFGITDEKGSKWLIEAKNITARYRPGSMIYSITDSMLGKGNLQITVLALGDAEGMIVKLESKNIPETLGLLTAFGGVTGKKFSRDGDLGADPESSFDLKPEYCMDNEYKLSGNTFLVYYGSGSDKSEAERYENNYQPTVAELEAPRLKNRKFLSGVFPPESQLKISDPNKQETPLEFYVSDPAASPALAGKIKLTSGITEYFLIANPETDQLPEYNRLPELFEKAELQRKKIAGRIKILTPDPYINTVGGALSIAADAIWDGKSYQHGAIAWRMPLNGWRGAYSADWLGWHDRAETHFSGYFDAQYILPASGPVVPDPDTHLARQKEEVGTALYTEGYISRSTGKINKPHHYDMNLVFIDQLLSHFRWTGNMDYLRKSWPVLVRHLAWEKRNFDGNKDGLYDAYCCIWASDALQYSGGGVTHSTAYNYRANKMAAELAVLIGKDPGPFQEEADKIKKAVDKQLWLPQKGWFAENKDLLGNQLVHPTAALWTVYHAIDEGLADPFQAWQTTKYVDKVIPHIPIRISGFPEGEFYTLSTSNWMPYNWSINNVASGEVLNTALAYWQAGRPDEAFKLTKSTVLDYMFLGTSPGNFGQLSYYDAFRGELYRDFADGIGVASRAMIEGLFGVSPDLINQTLTIRPGWPADWQFANLETPDVKIQFKREEQKDSYKIESHFPKPLKLKLLLKSELDAVHSIRINGDDCEWKLNENAIGFPELVIEAPQDSTFDVVIIWTGSPLKKLDTEGFYASGETLSLQMNQAFIMDFFDPQHIFKSFSVGEHSIRAELQGELGLRTIFVKLAQRQMTWWQPLSFELRKPFELVVPEGQTINDLQFSIRNNTAVASDCEISVNGFKKIIHVMARTASLPIRIRKEFLIPGTNSVKIQAGTEVYFEKAVNWNVSPVPNSKYESINLTERFNDRITNIFNEQYLSPRSPYPTLALPIQGIGDWCSYKETELIDDSGLRNLAGISNKITTPQGIPFVTPGNEVPNILFTSIWDNYPESFSLKLSGNARHIYFLMAGSGHHMQSRMTNGVLTIEYMDGTKEILSLVNPDTWWPIEQDYYEDGRAFHVDGVRPMRLYLKTGEWHLDTYDVWSKNKTIKIDGGAASVLDLPLNPDKELKQMTLETKANDVVIGLMAVTLVR